jgi:hypothetical protein
MRVRIEPWAKGDFDLLRRANAPEMTEHIGDSVARLGRPAETGQRLTVNVLVRLIKSALTANRATES